MGKKAVPIAHLKNDQNRRNTFKKRLIGLMKKIHDLSILCDAQIAVVVIDENKDIFPYTNKETIEEVWNQYFAKDNETKSNRLLECKKVLEIETKKIDMACHAKKKSKQDIPQNIGPNHSIPQNVGVHYDTFQNIEVHHQPNWSINSNRSQYQMSQRNTSSLMAPEQERNNNNWSNDTNGVNYGNTNHVNKVYQTPHYRTTGNNHQGYGYNIESQRHAIHHQSCTNLQDPISCSINVDDNHPEYGYNIEVQKNVHQQLWAILQDPLDYQIDVDNNHPKHGNNVEDQRHENCHQSPTLIQDPLNHPLNVNAFEEVHLAHTSLNLEALEGTKSAPSFGNLNTIVISSPSIGPCILPRDDPSTSIFKDVPSTMPPMQRDNPCTSPVKWKLMEDWEDLDMEDLVVEDLDLEDLEDIEDKKDQDDIEDS